MLTKERNRKIQNLKLKYRTIVMFCLKHMYTIFQIFNRRKFYKENQVVEKKQHNPKSKTKNPVVVHVHNIIDRYSRGYQMIGVTSLKERLNKCQQVNKKIKKKKEISDDMTLIWLNWSVLIYWIYSEIWNCKLV